MKLLLHQTHHSLCDFTGILKSFKELVQSGPGLHLFPELFLSGYPLQDLCLQSSFILAFQRMRQQLDEWSCELPPREDQAALVGGLDYAWDQEQRPKRIENAAFLWRPGRRLEKIYVKKLLPNYDIFDEKKYFTPGDPQQTGYLEFQGKRCAVMICEDMWASDFHQIDPCEILKEKDLNLDLIINLSASPFNLHKQPTRLERAQQIAHLFGCPFAYVNRVGGEDEILFDGQSFVHDGRRALACAPAFRAHTIELDCPSFDATEEASEHHNSLESLFDGDLEDDILAPLSPQDLAGLQEALIFGLQEYARKCGFNKFLVALSGGVDSALVLTLIQLGLQPGQSVEALFMPGLYTGTLSRQLSEQLCQQLGVPLRHFPIKFLHKSASHAWQEHFEGPLEGLADENIQSRLRGLILYTWSNQVGGMVVNTSNKSEIAVGYTTQYGDSVGAISLLGDLYKTEVFKLCRFINQQHPHLIPEEIITRPPTAELRSQQVDADSLPPYPILDPILEGILSYRYSFQDLVDKGFAPEDVKRVLDLYTRSEYKRYQFCPILKVKARSFGFGYRNPITKENGFFYL